MNNAFKSLGDFIAGLTGLFMSVIGLGVLAEIAGLGFMAEGNGIIDNITEFVGRFDALGFAGLVTLIIIVGLLGKK
tara:strand:+ start:2066 stop:2293 length:228 start_codon:yes stop_codon:yes gene_type:complete